MPSTTKFAGISDLPVFLSLIQRSPVLNVRDLSQNFACVFQVDDAGDVFPGDCQLAVPVRIQLQPIVIQLGDVAVKAVTAGCSHAESLRCEPSQFVAWKPNVVTLGQVEFQITIEQIRGHR